MYNPNQPRVPAGDRYGGRWTGTGLGGGPAGGPHHGLRVAGAGSAMPGIRGLAPFSPAMVPYLHGLLSQLASDALRRITFLGGLLVAALDQLGAVEGELPQHPDILYRYNSGILTLWQDVPGDSKPLLFHGPASADGLYRLPDGTVIGRDLGNGILLNQSAAAIKLEEYGNVEAANPAVNDNVKLCPDAVPDRPNNNKEGWQKYQQQITGLPKGLAVLLNGIMFDGCRMTDGVMLEAKGTGFAWAIKNGEFFKNYEGAGDMIKQMQDQSHAAAKAQRTVEWHVAEKPIADYLTKIAATLPHKNVTVVYTPPSVSTKRGENMGFSITISAFENEDSYQFPRANLRERFSKHLENTYGHESGFWPLSFSEGPSLAQLYVPDGDMISHFSVQRPPDYLEFWEIISGILRDFPCLLYWPNVKPVGIMGSLSLLPHIPKDFIHHMGIPFVSTDPERIRQYVWENS